MRVTSAQVVSRFNSEAIGLSGDDKKNLLREILQEVILCHMLEAGLFHEMAFHGGTSLRLLHRMNRFSEDLDLSLIHASADYNLPTRMEVLKMSLHSAGLNFEFQNKCKTGNPIQKYFINDSEFLRQFSGAIGSVIPNEKIKIKVELDVLPPDHQIFEMTPIQSAFSAKILAHNLPTCMGQKIHAVLCRGHGYGMNVIKGRDLYDLEWYLGRKVAPNYANLSACLNRLGPWAQQGLKVDENWVKQEIEISLKTKDFVQILEDIRPFVDTSEFSRIQQIWSCEYFMDLLVD